MLDKLSKNPIVREKTARIEKAVEMRKVGLNIKQVAATLGVSYRSVDRYYKEFDQGTHIEKSA